MIVAGQETFPISLRKDFRDRGFALVLNVLDAGTLADLADVLAVEPNRAGKRRLVGTSKQLDSVCIGGPLNSLADILLDRRCFPVRAILFDKTPESNWQVPWHQDVTIPVAKKVDNPGFGGWSQKEGVWHVQPPGAILAEMVTLRLHLDDCPESNGPLQMIPQSHLRGVMDRQEIEKQRATNPAVHCIAKAGDVLAMHPLVLHASKPAVSATHRRVLHVEYAWGELPGGLAWARS